MTVHYYAILWPCQERQTEAAKNDVFANCDQKLKPQTPADSLILCCRYIAADGADLAVCLSVVAPYFVLPSAHERLHPAHGSIGQWLLTVHAVDIRHQRTCSIPQTPTPKQTTVCNFPDCKNRQAHVCTEQQS